MESPRLPSLPAIAIEVIDLVQQEDVTIRQISETIQHDTALSTKILKTVNSSFYGQAHTISTISQALVVLGLNAVKSLALGFTLVNNLCETSSDGVDQFTFWRRSLYAAVAARESALQIGLGQQEEAFLGGLLQDLGVLAMIQTLGSDYEQLVNQAGLNHHSLRELEREHLQTDHTEIGGALAEAWNLPAVLVEPIRYHERPDKAAEPLLPLVRCVAMGGSVAHLIMSDDPAVAGADYYHQARDWFDMSSEQAKELVKTVHAGSIETKRLFDLPTGALENADKIMARANEALTDLNLQQQQRHAELRQKNQQLVQEVNTDSITGAANRRRFNDFITAAFDRVKTDGGEVSFLFLDADHFKRFNDTYGHQTGDRVLVELSATLQAAAGDGALVARYGGEEFAVVLPGLGRIEAAQFAEKMRQQIESMSVTSDEGEQLSVTASIGVASYNGDVFHNVAQFIKAADMAVYAAKSAGRNCVRVFTAKSKADVA
jgi:diguanylate cyclase (GGDEF)-like protein